MKSHHDSQTPVVWGLAGVAVRTSEEAVTARSGPSDFCKSPMASISASRALLRAVAISCPWLDARNEMLDKVSKPTAMTVSRIISESVITKAKPLDRRPLNGGFMKVLEFERDRSQGASHGVGITYDVNTCPTTIRQNPRDNILPQLGHTIEADCYENSPFRSATRHGWT